MDANGDALPAPPTPIRTVADLVTTLNGLTDRQRRGFGYWVDPKALLVGPARSRRSSREFRAATRAYDRLGDASLTREERTALRRRTVDEACWYEGGQVVGRLADAIRLEDRDSLERLAPALQWLQEAALTGADEVPIAIPAAASDASVDGPVGLAAAVSAPISEFERRFRGPLWGLKGAALFGVVCTLPFFSKPSLATPLASFGPPAAAFVVGTAWLLSIMRLIHWLGLKSEWSLVLKRRVLIAAFLAGPVGGLVVARIVAG